MVSAKVMVKNPSGLHLRPAGVLCEEALKFDSKISFKHQHSIANAKSVLSVLGACVKANSEIELICEGEDEEKALAILKDLIESGLGEEI